MRTKNRWLRLFFIMSAILFLVTGLSYYDQTNQSAVITDPNLVVIRTRVPEINNQKEYNHLKQLVFSDIAISSMTKAKTQEYQPITGTVVDTLTIYNKITNGREEDISKAEYKKLLSTYTTSILPHKTSLERVYLRIGRETGKRFYIISEHHYDYSPADVQHMTLEIQLRKEYQIIQASGKQIWWTSPSFQPKNINRGIITVHPEAKPTNADFVGVNQDESLFYHVNWKQPSLFEDAVGLHFYSFTRFIAKTSHNTIDVYVQGQNPHLSQRAAI